MLDLNWNQRNFVFSRNYTVEANEDAVEQDDGELSVEGLSNSQPENEELKYSTEEAWERHRRTVIQKIKEQQKDMEPAYDYVRTPPRPVNNTETVYANVDL